MPLFSGLDFNDDTPLVPSATVSAGGTGDNTYEDTGTWYGEMELGFGSLAIAIGHAGAGAWSSPLGENVTPSTAASASTAIAGADVIFTTQTNLTAAEGAGYGAASVTTAHSMTIGLDLDFMDLANPIEIELPSLLVPGTLEFIANILTNTFDLSGFEF